MINGLGVLGWGVGGIEAEAVMLGQAISMLLPQVVGYYLHGTLGPYITSTDLVLTITKVIGQEKLFLLILMCRLLRRSTYVNWVSLVNLSNSTDPVLPRYRSPIEPRLRTCVPNTVQLSATFPSTKIL